MTFPQRAKLSRGFSLVELLVTLALMIVLATMLFGFSSAKRQRTAKQLCGDNLQKIFLALQIYANDSRGNFPRVTNAVTSEDALDLLVPKYSTDTSIFICPGGRDSAIPDSDSLRKHKISYAYFMGRRADQPTNMLAADRLVDIAPKRIGELVFSANGKSPGNNHHKYGGNFLLADGSVTPSWAQLALPALDTNGIVLLNPKP
jgi:prepilin-type N-terminal cleavage/methylation domain-containing protein